MVGEMRKITLILLIVLALAIFLYALLTLGNAPMKDVVEWMA